MNKNGQISRVRQLLAVSARSGTLPGLLFSFQHQHRSSGIQLAVVKDLALITVCRRMLPGAGGDEDSNIRAC